MNIGGQAFGRRRKDGQKNPNPVVILLELTWQMVQGIVNDDSRKQLHYSNVQFLRQALWDISLDMQVASEAIV
jgi:hypothetical protein